MNIEAWTLVAILGYSLVVTLVTNWLAAGCKRPKLQLRLTLGAFIAVLANLIWIAIVFVFGVLAIRYVERMTRVVLGYVSYAAAAFMLSWARAYLFRRIQDQGQLGQQSSRQALTSVVVHNLTYLLFASVMYLALFGLLRRPVELDLLLPLFIGALLPDLDSRASLPGRLIPWISWRMEDRLGHLEEWHTPAAAVLVAVLTAPLILVFGVQAWWLIPFGFLTHLVLDLLTRQGIMLLWPVRSARFNVSGGPVAYPGCPSERLIAAGLGIAALILVFAVDFGPSEQPSTPVPSYEQTLERYYSMRGRTQVFAYIDGSWQLSGQPVSGRFEILNAVDQSYVLLDRYTGKVFTGGRTSADNVYLNRLILQSGPTVLVKPVEIHLADQRLGDAFVMLYEMQKDPGLQHIYVTGDLLLPDVQNATIGLLQTDHYQTSLRKIREQGLGQYSVHYLSAAELISLADLYVEKADLLVFATCVRPATGPTVTPLPTP